MAAGDPIADVDNVGAGASVDFTPAGSTKVLITQIGHTIGDESLRFQIGFGGVFVDVHNSAGWANVSPYNARWISAFRSKIFLNSSITFRRLNSSGAAKDFGYNGVEI
jgi:hypothetical protein